MAEKFLGKRRRRGRGGKTKLSSREHQQKGKFECKAC
jgi:hypothetical protein